MNKIDISIKKLNGLVLEHASNSAVPIKSNLLTCSLNVEMMRLGFIMSKDLMETFATLESKVQQSTAKKVISCLKKLKGDDVTYVPMYPNFPEQVMNMSHFELYMNAFLHYWSDGKWSPETAKLPRKFELEDTKFKHIKMLNEDQFSNLFTTLLSSNDSLSREDKSVIDWYLFNHDDLRYPEEIPYKETLCIIAVDLLNKNESISDMVKTSTDLLRVITHLNEGDISLTENTKFKSLPRSKRKYFTMLLENIITEEDIQRHRNKWVRLFHNLHVGEYSNKVRLIADKIRSNKKLETTAGKVQALMNNSKFVEASKLLMTRPGEFARRLDHLLRESNGNSMTIIDNFHKVHSNISTRVLMQLVGHFKSRNNIVNRVIFPKGNTQKAVMIDTNKIRIPEKEIRYLLDGIESTLLDRFSKLKPLGNVFIDERLKKCPLPAQQRSSSTGLNVVARGTRLPIDNDKNTLRFFIHWIGIDIDLSATLHNDDFSMIEHISYTNLKSTEYQSVHSGDIIRAPGPKGASEFIDITMDKAFEYGVRYIVMNVLVFNGPNFSEHEKCYAGWMTRSKPKSNEMFDPKTVESKIDLQANSKNAIPVIFDLKTREAIWCDLITPSHIQWQEESSFDRKNRLHGNNVQNNKASIEDVLKSIISLDNKSTLHDLLTLHALARGNIVDVPNDADVLFGIEGDVTPRDVNIINSEFLV